MIEEIAIDKVLGCLYGQAIGDALGLGAEFMSKEEVLSHYPSGLSRYEQIVQDEHRCRWAKGAWTDDTDMMICIMDAFERGAFNYHKVARNFKDWFNGNPLGIGGHTYKVLCSSGYAEKPEVFSKLWWNVSCQHSAANGALMRTSVVGLAKNQVGEQAENICRLTHYAPRCVGSCVIVSEVIHNLVWHNSSDISLLDLDENVSIGYTLRTLSAALWSYWHAKSFEDGLLSVVNAGGDTDTNAAISCAILGAKFGCSSIPKYYIENLHNRAAFHQKATAFIRQLMDD